MQVREILRQYSIDDAGYRVEALTSGLINVTWKVSGDAGDYLLQRINTGVDLLPLAGQGKEEDQPQKVLHKVVLVKRLWNFREVTKPYRKRARCWPNVSRLCKLWIGRKSSTKGRAAAIPSTRGW